MSTIWVDMLGVPIRQTYYQAGGYRTRAIECGEGPPLIFPHGTGGHAEAGRVPDSAIARNAQDAHFFTNSER